ncbi:GlcNAc-PI de-N-acetylase [Colletotrichum graminicola]|uniref:N-acetylglucosaminylphosphatidylinositol deacetylase n=1 Tax=Colletotrichum graminicola (strain M1.001 / M2 / FGSC 10212) TaxID=645133 RepID=E3Q2L6_COLGM|nr:GlcNAc-PI de-N-acetylase [Colletotrichum graminicola M1.001]EFQ25317.1 GlcNAc-PI de-N-acetylase [Colletotrichum graminicola M1.001]WDK15015.1 GlcNAc-PI de-N-acetylase [Colletotrichum graminicola]
MASYLFVGALSVAVTPALYTYLVRLLAPRLSTLENKRICLLIAHPDDEAMFFAPTVLALTKPDTGNHVKILCLSSGDADGLGETRKKELVKSGMKLGLQQEQDVFVIESPDFQDSMTKTWDETKIAALLGRAFAPQLARQRAAGEQPAANIDVLITFDAAGVSSHPNHISLYHGARAFISALSADPRWPSPVDLYTLTSVSLLRKYSNFLDTIPTLLSWATTSGSNPPKPPKKPKKTEEGENNSDEDDEDEKDDYHPTALVFLSGLGTNGGWATAWSAMTTAHKSQMVWFRYGWLSLSRYMVINDLRLETVVGAQEAKLETVVAAQEAKARPAPADKRKKERKSKKGK